MNLGIVVAPTSSFLSNRAVYLLFSGKYPQSHHAEKIAIDVFSASTRGVCYWQRCFANCVSDGVCGDGRKGFDMDSKHV